MGPSLVWPNLAALFLPYLCMFMGLGLLLLLLLLLLRLLMDTGLTAFIQSTLYCNTFCNIHGHSVANLPVPVRIILAYYSVIPLFLEKV